MKFMRQNSRVEASDNELGAGQSGEEIVRLLMMADFVF